MKKARVFANFSNTLTQISVLMGQGASSFLKTDIHSHFDKKELQAFSEAFGKNIGGKQQLSKQDLCIIYSKYFPFGDPTAFVEILFRLFKLQNNLSETIGFEEYISAWSVASRGNLEERIRWSFKFHDVDSDGILTADDLENVLSACLQLTRGLVSANAENNTLINQIFDTFDAAESKSIEYSAYASIIRTNPHLLKGFLLFDGLL